MESPEPRTVRYRESGGYAGLLRGAELEAAALPPAAADALKALVARREEAPRTADGGAARDLMSYEITIETDEGPITLELDDASIPDYAAPLVDYLRERSAPRPPS